jgi:hypothetical protein
LAASTHACARTHRTHTRTRATCTHAYTRLPARQFVMNMTRCQFARQLAVSRSAIALRPRPWHDAGVKKLDLFQVLSSQGDSPVRPSSKLEAWQLTSMLASHGLLADDPRIQDVLARYGRGGLPVRWTWWSCICRTTTSAMVHVYHFGMYVYVYIRTNEYRCRYQFYQCVSAYGSSTK